MALNEEPEYDVIVVGAGAAGSPLAARLAENPDLRVLLIEAGPGPTSEAEFPKDLLDASMMTGAMPGHPNNWAFVANLTPELSYSVARGKILGGSTSLNGTYFIWGRRQDFDTYAALGNTEWSFDKVLPFFKKLETDLTFGESRGHGASGPIPIYRAEEAEQTEHSKAFINVCKELGFIWEEDKNSESTPGVGPVPVNAVNGTRINTGIAYVLPALKRKNFTLMADTFVQRATFNGTKVNGVEVKKDGDVQTITAREVVLACGAIKTPHTLALSGVGPKKELVAAGIPLLVDLPGVGKNFSDHPELFLNWSPKRKPDLNVRRDIFQYVLNFSSIENKYDGDLEIMPMLRPMAVAMGLESGKTFKTFIDVLKRPIASLKSLRGVSLPRFLQQLRHSRDLSFVVAVQQAESRGNITTVSNDPNVYPKIDYNYLEHESDLRRMREAVRTTVKILKSEAFKPVFKRFTEIDDATLHNDKKLDRWMKAHLATAIHAAGSCSMGADPEHGAVVDQYGRVYGVTGLRIADTSILPFVPSRGPAATSVMIGERMADLMLAGAGAIR
ncbi:MAG TPA: GMC oxidoreductase [Microbacteriaceae bacterium]|nr:GMC oxidoreductase [Microbacteriaceae bacterium]